jgi:hypothetical protein
VRTIITFIIVIVVVNAAIRAGTAYWKFYQFKDAAQEIAVFGGKTATSLLHQQVMDKATKLDIPIDPHSITIERTGEQTTIGASYIQNVELFPRYTQDLSFHFSVEGMGSGSLAAKETR